MSPQPEDEHQQLRREAGARRAHMNSKDVTCVPRFGRPPAVLHVTAPPPLTVWRSGTWDAHTRLFIPQFKVLHFRGCFRINSSSLLSIREAAAAPVTKFMLQM